MMIRLSDGYIGFEGLDINNQCAPVSQFWKPTTHDLKEFADNVEFWSQVVATRRGDGTFSYQRVSGDGMISRKVTQISKGWTALIQMAFGFGLLLILYVAFPLAVIVIALKMVGCS